VYDFIHANYQRDIGLQDIADAVGVTPNYLANKFKQETGGTIIAYLTEYRMNEARKLLSETTLKVYEIAERIGYTNPNYFCHVFKKEAGSSPGAYRNSQTP
jgi:two-component system response regulator YesN